jgi:hexosaminidase
MDEARPAFRLDSDFSTGEGAAGAVTLTLRNVGSSSLSNFRLAFTSLVRIKSPESLRGGTIVEQVSNYVVVEPPAGTVIEPGGNWSISANQLSHALTHYNYGPKSAYLILADGSLTEVAVSLMTRDGVVGVPALNPRKRPPLPDGRTPIALVPFPAEASVEGAREPTALSFAAGPPEASVAFDAAAALAGRLFPGERLLFGEHGIAVSADTMPMADGAYRLSFSGGGVHVEAANRSGFLHGVISLGQILRGARIAPGEFAFPGSGEIRDAPRFGFRGMHLDVARQFYGIDAIRRLVDCMAWLKLNRFHLHLTDDEGWRFDVPGYPELVDRAAWRGHGLTVPPLLGSGPERYGGIYSRMDLSELVRHALGLGVTIIPEVDIPGHCYCVVQALPQLRDPGETGVYRSIQYFPNDALNPAVPKVHDFLEAVLGELARIFPSPWLHIGGDEVADDAWLGSPLALALMKERGWDSNRQLQAFILRRAQEAIGRLGRGVGAWEEAAHGGGIASENSYLVAWRKSASGIALAKQGYDVVMAPAENYYFDLAQSEDWWEPGMSWAGNVPLTATYGYEPGSDWPEALRTRLIGVQACLWGENMHDRQLVDHMLFPRMPAMAETAWTPPRRKDFARFLATEPLLFRRGERVGR